MRKTARTANVRNRAIARRPGPLRVAIYIRLSKETETTTSPERQRNECQREAARRGWEVVMIEEDVDVSATKKRLDRPGLDRIRAAYGDLDAVLFWKVDRLARSLVDFATLMEEAEAADVALVSATEPVDLSTPMGRAMAQIIAIFAEMEARTIGLRMKSLNAHLRRVGRAPGGIKAYGYRSIPNPAGQGRLLEPDPVRAPALREAADRVLKGETLPSICVDLTRRGIPTSRGVERWRPSSLVKMLRNPAVLGYTISNGRVLRGEDGLPRVFWKPILDRATFDAVQAELADRLRPRVRRWNGSAWLLSGLLTCGHCGAPLYANAQRGKREGEPKEFYRCSTRSNAGECPGNSVMRRSVEDHVVTDFLRRVGRFPVLEPVAVARDDNSDAVAETRAALADLETDRYERNLFRGPEGAARFATLYGRLEDRLRTLEATHVADLSEPEWRATGETFAEAWASADTMSRRALLLRAVEAIEVSKGAIGGRIPISDRVRIDYTAADALPLWDLEDDREVAAPRAA